MFSQHHAAAVVHEARGRADIGVAVVGDVLFDEIDEARVALQQAEQLQRGDRARFLQWRRRGCGFDRRGGGAGHIGHLWRFAQALHAAREGRVVENAEEGPKSNRNPAKKDDQKSFRDAGSVTGVSEPEGHRRANIGRHRGGGPLYPEFAGEGKGRRDGPQHAESDARVREERGTVKAFQLWDPGQLGYLAAFAAANLASGTISGKEGDSFEAGKLGKRTVGKNGEVILGPPTTFDSSNIDNFHF